MAESLKRPKWWPKKLMWFGIGFLILLIILWFVATSAAFFKGVILPRVGAAMNAKITVSDASISPFSHVILKDFKVMTTGTEPLVTAQEVRARYSLFKMLGGTMKIDEVAVVSPVVQIIENVDGTSNLDPILKSQKDDKETEKKDEKSEAAQVDLKKFNLSNATVRRIKHHQGGTRDVAELSNVNVTLDDLKNGQTAKLVIGANIKLDNNPPAPGTNGSLQAKLNGNFTAAFSAALAPTSIQGSSQLGVQNASGNMAELTGLSAQLISDVTPTEIKQVALQFKKGNAALGEVRANGPLDLNEMEGQVNVTVSSIDKQVLNLVGAAAGIDFGSTVINSTNQIQFANAGKTLTALGQLAIAKLSIARDKQVTPPMDLQLDYNAVVNSADKSADVRTFTLNGVQQQRSVIKGELTSPMRMSWGNAAATAGDSTFRLVVDNLNLADWKAVAGDIAGRLSLTFNLQSQQSGKQLALDVTSQIDGLSMALGSNTVQSVAVSLRTRGQAVDLKKISLPELRLETTHAGQPMLTLTGNVQMDREAQTTDAQLTLDGALPTLLKTLSRPDAMASAGAINGQLRVAQKGEAQTVNGKLSVASFTGQFGEQKFNGFSVSADLDAAMKGTEMELRKAAGAFTSAGNPGGNFDATGKYDSAKQTGQFDLKLANINENAVRPFLEPMFPGKQLVTVSINGNATARYEPNGESTVKADFKVVNLAVRDPKKRNPQLPLSAEFKLDSSFKNQVGELRQCQFALAPTSRARNIIDIRGRLDTTIASAMQGNLKVTADSLDVTPYYDLIAGDKEPEQPAAPGPAQPAPSPGDLNKEPDPIKLPFRNTVADIQIGRVYLRQIDIANFRSTAKIDGSAVLLKPFEMTVNGAPVSASVDLDLSVPGYKYDIAFNANKVPVEPLANSLSPEYKGQAKGELIADIKLAGAGTTGVNLKKTLKGQTSFTFTNANIQLVSKWRVVLVPIATVLRLNELLKSPINWLNANASIGDGKINLTQMTVVSEAFIAESQGAIPIADVLTNSPVNLPLEMSLRRSLAQRANLVPSNTPTNTDFVKLPTFARVKGTIGAPKSDTDERVIVGLIAKSAAGIPGAVGGDAGKILQGVGSLLTGERGTNRGSATTNQTQTATNKAPSLFDLIPRRKKE